MRGVTKMAYWRNSKIILCGIAWHCYCVLTFVSNDIYDNVGNYVCYTPSRAVLCLHLRFSMAIAAI
jgi:hypothetical protein